MRSNVQDDPGASLVGFVLGPILFFMAFVVIWVTEKKSAIDYTRLKIVNELLEGEEGTRFERPLS